jgi:hypothetical protein
LFVVYVHGCIKVAIQLPDAKTHCQRAKSIISWR